MSHPVVIFPPTFEVLDLTEFAMDPTTLFWVGRYNERRRGVYEQALFDGGRCVHMGVDLGGPAGVAVHAFGPGEVVYAGYNPAPGDYGHTLVCRHVVEGEPLFVLLGHLSAASLGCSPVGRSVQEGEVLGWLGHHHENGGWPAHVHVQLCRADPGTFDLPGTVTLNEREAACRRYPDPRLVLGPVY